MTEMNINDVAMNQEDRELLECGAIDEDQVNRTVILEEGEEFWFGNEDSQPIDD